MDPNIQRQHVSLDLNGCLANYKGTLNGVLDGGFGASCPNCDLDATYKLTCDCETGSNNETMKTSFDLSYWRAVRLSDDGGSVGIMCWHDYGMNDE
ncbi:hypothetical protein F5X98DRAFT_345852 [Xylaria grammica]|nr:hypothetical protein F5X98DRAFT_345852 [Xylaria grammica]